MSIPKDITLFQFPPHNFRIGIKHLVPVPFYQGLNLYKVTFFIALIHQIFGKDTI